MLEIVPTRYFAECELRESLVLLFAFASHRKVLDLVIDYASEAVSQAFERQLAGVPIERIAPMPRDMRHFRFESTDVAFTRSGTKTFSLATLEEYLNYRPRVIEGVAHGHANEGYQMELAVGGVVRITILYKKLFVESRRLVGRASGSKNWEYRDVTTGELVDFYNPFPGIRRERSKGSEKR